jgi:hypothetical protein
LRNILENAQSSEVTALFADDARSFALPKGATLENLADRLALLERREPLMVTVRLDS